MFDLGVSSINFANGFASGGMNLIGSATLNGSALELTDGGGYEAAAAWYQVEANIETFTTDFTFQITPGTNPTADGLTFAIQGNNSTAVGPSGGGLGYGPAAPGGTGGIPNSVAVKFDLYSNEGEGTDSTGLYTNGASPTTPAVDMTSSGVNLHSGDPFHVHITYDGTTLGMTITDTTTNATFATNWTVDIQTIVGDVVSYVGFTAGTGGDTAVQNIVSWTYSTGSSTSPPTTPTNLMATAGNGQVGLSWSASSGATSYNVQRSTTSGGAYTTIASPTTTSYTDTGVTNGTTYYYVVSAVNTAGESTNSSQVSATPQLAIPPAPTNLVATAGNGQVGLSWSASSGATSYNVQRSTTSGGAYTTIASPTTTSYTDTGVTNGTTYYYVVSAVNTAGESANSSQVSATPTASTVVINYGSGFSSSGLQLNGSTKLNGTRLRLTDGGGFEASSAFYSTPVNVQSFTTNFSFQMTSAAADGMTFVIQNGAATALGAGGGALGYEGIGNSVAVKFDIYSNAGEGTDSTGMYVDGAVPTVPAVDMTSSGVKSTERRRDECAAELQRDDADTNDHGCEHVEEFHDQLDGEHPGDGGKHDGAGRVHGRHGRVDSDSGCSELDLQYRVEHESAGGADEPGGDGGEWASGVELECVEWGDELQREAVDDERGAVHDDRQSDDGELHGHGVDEWDDVLLRGVGGEHGGGECEFQPGECDAAAGDTTGTDEPSGDGGEWASGVELECVEWGDELQREAVDDERGSVHDDCESDDDQLHGHGSDERDDVLLRGVGGEHGGAECEFQPGECDTDCVRDQLR